MKRRFLGIGLLLGLIAVAFVAQVNAAPLTLPPRPELEPTPGTSPGEEPPERLPRGAWIELQARSVTQPGTWCVVQWQDESGNWRSVESWRGQFDQIVDGIGVKMWWVGMPEWGKGPFRWTIYVGNQELGTSATFYLPKELNQKMVIPVMLSAR